jgi:hypothetical protein
VTSGDERRIECACFRGQARQRRTIRGDDTRASRAAKSRGGHAALAETNDDD